MTVPDKGNPKYLQPEDPQLRTGNFSLVGLCPGDPFFCNK